MATVFCSMTTLEKKRLSLLTGLYEAMYAAMTRYFEYTGSSTYARLETPSTHTHTHTVSQSSICQLTANTRWKISSSSSSTVNAMESLQTTRY